MRNNEQLSKEIVGLLILGSFFKWLRHNLLQTNQRRGTISARAGDSVLTLNLNLNLNFLVVNM